MRRILAAVTVFVAVAVGCASDDPAPQAQTFEDDTAGEADADPAGAGDDTAFPPQNPLARRPTELEDLTGQPRVEVEVADNVFRTRNFIVDPGTEIVFINVGANPHNVLPAAEGAFTPIPDTALDSGPAALVLDTPGDYAFYCSIHGGVNWGQTGFVVVAGN